MIIKLFTLDRYSHRADDSCSITLTTLLEATDQDILDFKHLKGSHCVVAIKPEDSPFKEPELADLDKIDIDLYDKKRSPSQRLRNVLWVLQQQQLGQKPTDIQFSEFYRIKMGQMIEHYKDKLE